jgi:acetyl-CoA carboxylase biotin carboxyl carrier protein
LTEENEKPRAFDVRTIEYLVRLMSENDLSEIDLSEGDERIRLRRGARLVAAPPVPLQALPAPVASHAPAPAPAAPEQPARKLLEIKSQLVGTFYLQREPGAPPLVTVGSRVTPTTPVCVIVAMKVNNEIQADCSGTIAEICVKNEEFVEFNTVLFRVDPSS